MAVLLSRGGRAVGAVWFFERNFSRYASCVTVGSEVFWFAEAVLSGRGSRGPAPHAGRRAETGTTRADAAPCGAPRPPRVRPASAAVRAASRPERQAQLVFAALRRNSCISNVSGGGQQHTELIGPEAAATGAVDLQSMQFLDPVLYFATAGSRTFS